VVREGTNGLALVGSSGVGEIDAAQLRSPPRPGEDAQRPVWLREDDAKGRHTTRSRSLMPCGGGWVIDFTPGMRTLHVSDCGAGLDVLFWPRLPSWRQLPLPRTAPTGTNPAGGASRAVAAGTLDPEGWSGLAASWMMKPPRTRPQSQARVEQASRDLWQARSRSSVKIRAAFAFIIVHIGRKPDSPQKKRRQTQSSQNQGKNVVSVIQYIHFIHLHPLRHSAIP